MRRVRDYVGDFFAQLEVYEDMARGHNYKAFMSKAADDFLTREDKQSALTVYETFFGTYRIKAPGDGNAFVDLLDVLSTYEQSAATLIDRQRDHYIHSVNVFLLGLAVYIGNTCFRDAFNAACLDRVEYPYAYSTRHEEFFYRWGVTALFHDVGYPIEIIAKQLSKYLCFVCDCESPLTSPGSLLQFRNMDLLNRIDEINPRAEFTNSYTLAHAGCDALDLLKPTDLLSHSINRTLGLELSLVQDKLAHFPESMGRHGFVDHGYFSALIVLKWYGNLFQRSGFKSEYFFSPVLDSASAILLHNFYRNVLMKAPFCRGSLKASEHPLAFLLILCDELQEWNRPGYGKLDQGSPGANEVLADLTDTLLSLVYFVREGLVPEGFAEKNKALLESILDLRQIFPDGLHVDCQPVGRAARREPVGTSGAVTSRVLMENLEKLAVMIHADYNRKQLLRYPNQELEFPTFNSLPDTLKYSNLRQAKGILDKLSAAGYSLLPKGSPSAIKEFPAEVVEQLAEYEHEQWVTERMATGWRSGEIRDANKKTTPYLVNYNELPEDVKEFDRDAIRNIIALADLMDMAVYPHTK